MTSEKVLLSPAVVTLTGDFATLPVKVTTAGDKGTFF